MQNGKPNLVWAGLLALGSAYLAYQVIETLRTGVAKGKGDCFYDRKKDPVLYWANVALTGGMACALAYAGLGFL